jgi:cell wall-associated NlpC family hydrolase
MRAVVLASIAAACLAGCAAPPPVRVALEPAMVVPRADEIGVRAAALAERFIGVPYRFGGDSPQGFDCSGLVWYVYRELGVAVPRTAAEQRASARHVDADGLQPGDLVFFYTPADHVGLYLGGGEFLHAPSSGKRVERARLDAPFFILGYAGGGRFSRP